jgi:tetratricopeptide (TPR) repeat protein
MTSVTSEMCCTDVTRLRRRGPVTRVPLTQCAVQQLIWPSNALTHLGDTYRKLGRLEESHEHYQRSLTFHEEHQNQLGQANSLKGLGHVYLRMDDIKLAKVSFEKALELHKAVNDLVGQANDVSSLAEVYQRLDNLADG